IMTGESQVLGSQLDVPAKSAIVFEVK
ncbi:MAG: hypothetical protein RL432_1871, partial [Bacteroidota bacterium]